MFKQRVPGLVKNRPMFSVCVHGGGVQNAVIVQLKHQATTSAWRRNQICLSRQSSHQLSLPYSSALRANLRQPFTTN